MTIISYPIRINSEDRLCLDEDIVTVYFVDKNSIYHELVCKTKNEIMISSMKQKNETEWKEEYISSNINKTVIDLNENGIRWEGDSFNGKCIGYGSIYDESNVIIYTGFVYDKYKVGYGITFYKDTEKIEYCGNFFLGKRHGYGKLYDKKETLIYEGEWCNDKPVTVSSCIIEDRNDFEQIHFAMEEIMIASGCKYQSDSIVLKEWPYLKRLIMENDCCHWVKVFKITNCKELFSISIGVNCCDITKSQACFCIKDCPQLYSIHIDNNSFVNYDGEFTLQSKE